MWEERKSQRQKSGCNFRSLENEIVDYNNKSENRHEELEFPRTYANK